MKASIRNRRTTIPRNGPRYIPVLLAIVLFAALPVAAQPWNIEIEIGNAGSAFEDRGYSIAATADGGAIGIGPSRHASTGNMHITLVRLDPQGNVVWTQVYSAWAPETMVDDNEFSIIETSNGDFAWTTSVSYLNNPGSNRDAIVCRTDAFGTPLWTFAYGISDLQDYGASIIEVAGDIVVAGTVHNAFANTSDVLLFRLDQNGVLQWGFTYNVSTLDVGRCVREDTDGNFVIVGETLCSDGESMCRTALMIKTDPNGVPIWARRFGQDVGSAFNTVEIGVNGDYYACGGTNILSTVDGYIAHVDRLTGTLTNASVYNNGGPYDTFWHIASSWTSGNFVLTGAAFTTGAGPNKVIAMEIGPGLGAPLWARLYGPTNELSAGYCIVRALPSSAPLPVDRGYWIFGHLYFTATEQQMFALRTDSASAATSCSDCVTLEVSTNTAEMAATVVADGYNVIMPLPINDIDVLPSAVVCAGSDQPIANCTPDTVACPDTCYWTLQGNGGTNPTDNYLGTTDNADLSIRTNAVEHVRVTTTGNVGINQSSPLNTFDVAGNSVIGSTFAGTVVAPASSLLVENELGVGYSINPGSYTLYVNGGIRALSANIGSDRRWKRDIITINDALSKVLQLRGVGYDFNREAYPNLRFPQGRQLGFIAQELEQIVPEVVTIEKGGYKSIAYHELTALLVESTKQQQQLIEELQSSNAQLMTQVEELRRIVAKDPTTDIDIEDNSSQFRPGNKSSARLGVNDPNPFSESTKISYYLPETTRRAELVVYRVSSGAEAGRFALSQRGNGSIRIDARNFESGAYLYVLMVDETPADRGEMVIVK